MVSCGAPEACIIRHARRLVASVSKCAEIELEGQRGVHLERIGNLIEGVVVLNYSGIDFAVIGVQLGLALKLDTEVKGEVDQFAGNGTAPADAYLGAEAIHLQAAGDIALRIYGYFVSADDCSAACGG